MDVIELIGKDPDKKIRENGPMLHPYLKEMNENTFAGKELMTVGENVVYIKCIILIKKKKVKHGIYSKLSKYQSSIIIVFNLK